MVGLRGSSSLWKTSKGSEATGVAANSPDGAPELSRSGRVPVVRGSRTPTRTADGNIAFVLSLIVGILLLIGITRMVQNPLLK